MSVFDLHYIHYGSFYNFSTCLDVMFDDDDEVRDLTIGLVRLLAKASQPGQEQLHSQLAVRWLASYCINTLGKVGAATNYRKIGFSRAGIRT